MQSVVMFMHKYWSHNQIKYANTKSDDNKQITEMTTITLRILNTTTNKSGTHGIENIEY